MLKKIALPFLAAVAATVSLASPASALVLTDFVAPADTQVLMSGNWTTDTTGCPQGESYSWAYRQQMTFVVIVEGHAEPQSGMFCTNLIYPIGDTFVSGSPSPGEAEGEYINAIGNCAC